MVRWESINNNLNFTCQCLTVYGWIFFIFIFFNLVGSVVDPLVITERSTPSLSLASFLSVSNSVWLFRFSFILLPLYYNLFSNWFYYFPVCIYPRVLKTQLGPVNLLTIDLYGQLYVGSLGDYWLDRGKKQASVVELYIFVEVAHLQ